MRNLVPPVASCTKNTKFCLMSGQQVECPIQSEALIFVHINIQEWKGSPCTGLHDRSPLLITCMHCYYLLEITWQHGLAIPPTMAIEKSKDEKHQQHDKALIPNFPEVNSEGKKKSYNSQLKLPHSQ